MLELLEYNMYIELINWRLNMKMYKYNLYNSLEMDLPDTDCFYVGVQEEDMPVIWINVDAESVRVKIHLLLTGEESLIEDLRYLGTTQVREIVPGLVGDTVLRELVYHWFAEVL